MKILAFILLALCSSWSFADSDLSNSGQHDLQQRMESVLAEEGLTGVSWALLKKNGELSFGMAGMQDNQSKIPFAVDTRFHVGSISKSLLATGVLQLATTGALDIDQPVSSYLPDLPFDNPWADTSEVAVRHLLDHTSGLEDARIWHLFSERSQPDSPLEDAFPESMLPLNVRSPPGDRFSYSNSGYTILGMIIESVTGLRYETYLNERLLPALDMNNSTFSYTTQIGEQADPLLAWGHVDDGSRYAAQPVFLRPAAQFTTTSSDLMRFAQFLLGDGQLNGQVFVEKSLMGSRGRPSTTEAANHGLEAGYALGLGRRDRHGVTGLCHGGNIVGFSAMLCVFPDEGKAMLYSVNTDHETADYGRIAAMLIEALSVETASQPPTGKPATDIAQWHGRYVLSPNRFQMFEYLDTVFGAIKISAEGDSLAMTNLQQKPRQLRPVGGYQFSANDRATTSHVFFRGHEGEFLISDGFKTYQKVSNGFLVVHWVSVSLGLLGLGWLLLSGIFSLIRRRSGFLDRPVAPAFICLLALLIPIPFFMTQSFMALGDLTLASALMALFTMLLPLGLILTIWRVYLARLKSFSGWSQGLAAIFALQWCVVLAVAGLLPLRLWA